MYATRRRAAAQLGWLLFCGACFRTTAPEGWLSTPEVAQREAYGGWISAAYAPAQVVEGELIAVTPESLYVLTADSLIPLAMGAITSAALTTYDAQLRTLEMWTLLGSASTLSHGVGLVLTLPLWVIAGSSVTASASKSPRVRSLDPADLRPYARFPQGLPPALDRRDLRQKQTARMTAR